MRRPNLRAVLPRRRWLRIPVVGLLLVLVLGVGAGLAQWIAFRGDSGPPGCVANPVRLSRDSDGVDRCLLKRLQATIDDQGVVQGLAKLHDEEHHNPVFESRCHLPMHIVGQRMERRGFTTRQLGEAADFLDLQDVCAKGFVHGYMQALGAEPRATVTSFITAASKVCGAMQPGDRAVCVHGVGHGIARADDNRLGAAARNCQRLPRGDQSNCVKGVVMEIEFTDPALHGRLAADHGLGPRRKVDCAAVPASERHACRTRKAGDAALNLVFRLGGA